MNVLRGVLFENLGLKLVAIVLALVVYLHVYTERPATMVVSFPIEVTDLADTLAVMSQTPVAVAAEFRGTGKQLIRLRLAERRVPLSLLGVGPGRYQRRIGTEDLPIGTSGAPQVTRFIGPQMLEMQIEKVAQRVVPVAVRLDGMLPSEYVWPVSWSVEPARVTVRGPGDALKRIDSLELTAVRLEPGRDRDTIRAVVGPASPCPGCEITPPAVTVSIPLVRRR